ncbi:MAG: BatD family protein, partial [Pirellulales bacterium]|nr:BatD family protein [Pirellulales bacterium]
QFTWSADLKPTDCKVGDPVTLTLALRGQGSLDGAAAPDLAQVPAVAEHFKTYSGTRETKGDTCRFTYTLRPLSADITEFPSIPGAYFDVDQQRYVTLDTAPIPMHVEKAAAMADRQIVGAGGASRTPQELEVRREGIFANVTDPGQLVNESVNAEVWLIGLGGLAGLYAAIAIATGFVRRRSADPAIGRRRSAAGRARGRLRQATSLLKSNDARGGAEGVRGALVGLVADAADLAEAGMTTAEACRRLRHLGAEAAVVDRLGKTLEACDAARYTPDVSNTNGLADEASETLDSVVRSLKKQKCLR